MLDLQEKIRLIEESNSFLDLNKDILPKVHKEDYYFVSYSHKDYKKVMKDILLLEDAGINIWYDSDMHIGENWEDIANMYISKFQCKGIIFYLSKNSILSKACNKEVEYVLENDKQFFSINISENAQYPKSGLDMLLDLKAEGFDVDEELIENFEKAFSNKVLYLSYEDSIIRKKEQIEKLVGEDLFFVKGRMNTGNSHYYTEISECRDNSLVKLNLKNKYMINDEKSNYYNQYYQLGFIDQCAFANLFQLKEVHLPDTVDEIGEFSFKNCFKLKDINLNIPLTYIRDYAFSNCKALDVDKINCRFVYKFAFENCTSLRKIELSSFEIGSFAFTHCSNLEEIRFTNDLLKLDSYVFRSCRGLKNIYFNSETPNVINAKKDDLKLGNAAFEECYSLKEMTLKGKIDLKYAHDLFCECKNLEKVTFNLKKFDTMPSAIFMLCEKLNQVNGIEKVKKIESNAFYKCSELTDIDLSNVLEIEEHAFVYAGIKEANLLKIKRVEELAFGANPNLEKIVIGENIEEIESHAFYALEALKELEVLGKNFYYDNNSFDGMDPEIITVREEQLLDYLLEYNGENLQTLYFEKNLLKVGRLNKKSEKIFKKVKSDKDDFDKFVVVGENKFGKYQNKKVIVELKNGDRYFSYCSEAGYDEERGEYYIVLDQKYYESEIESISKDFYML